MNTLPGDLAPPLHLMEPGSSAWLLYLGLLLAVLTLLSYWQRRRAGTAVASPAPEPTVLPMPTLSAEIEALRSRFARQGDYRRGCHELSRLLRRFFEGTRTLTAREVHRVLSDPEWPSLFEELARFQFRRDPPRRTDFDRLCRQAQAASGAASEDSP